MKIDKFLTESPVFAITKTARTVEINLARAIENEGLGFSQALVLIAVRKFFDYPGQYQSLPLRFGIKGIDQTEDRPGRCANVEDLHPV